jgi:hypothetical protein
MSENFKKICGISFNDSIEHIIHMLNSIIEDHPNEKLFIKFYKDMNMYYLCRKN